MAQFVSELFTSASQSVLVELENCAKGFPDEVVSHFASGSAHNSRDAIILLQQGLLIIGRNHPELSLSPFQVTGIYDAPFAKAVTDYKTTHGLLNFQHRIDPIIGRKTIVAMDPDLKNFPEPTPTPPPPAPHPNIDPHPVPEFKGIRKLSSGMWNKSSSITLHGGQIMIFKMTNMNMLPVTVQISSTLVKQSLFMLPATSGELEFDNFMGEPQQWTFSIDAEDDTYFIMYELWSSWIPGDPSNR